MEAIYLISLSEWGNVVSGVFANVPWGTSDKWLKVEMDLGGGSNYQLMGATQFLSVPYALSAKNGNLPGVNFGDMQYWDDTTWVTIPAGNPGQVLTVSANNKLNWTTKVSLGDFYQGGVVFYLLRPDDIGYDLNITHGLIAVPSNKNTAQWGCYGISIPGTNTAIGTGAQNTTAIVAGCAQTGIGAKNCDDLILNGYNDWFLPSRDELNLMYQNNGVIGGFGTSDYWSSSEYDNGYAWFKSFNSGYQYDNNKNFSRSVRAIRAF